MDDVGVDEAGSEAADPNSPAEPEVSDFELVLGRRQIAAVLLIALGALAVSSSAAYVVGKAAGRSVLAALPVPIVKPQSESAEAAPAIVEPVVLPTMPAREAAPQEAPKKDAAVANPVLANPATKGLALANATTKNPVVNDSIVKSSASKDAAPKQSHEPVQTAKLAPDATPVSMKAENVKADSRKRPLVIEPGPGQIYLQVAAVERNVAMDYAQKLRGESLDAAVAAAPGGTRFRVLIGPFADEAALRRGKNQAEKAGLPTITRKY